MNHYELLKKYNNLKEALLKANQEVEQLTMKLGKIKMEIITAHQESITKTIKELKNCIGNPNIHPIDLVLRWEKELKECVKEYGKNDQKVY